jgi:nucleoside-diphosphate-sugar epimerase
LKILVIGGTGHIGSFLTPMLAEAGHDVTVVTRGERPISQEERWKSVKSIKASYTSGNSLWCEAVAAVEAEVVIDILGRDLPAVYDTVKGTCRQLIACGSIWMFGEPKIVPTPEAPQGICPSEGYNVRFPEMLRVKKHCAEDGIAFTAIMPPNICGPGNIPLDLTADRSIDVHRALQRGEEVALPAPGSNLISPCDAEDVAQGFALAVAKREAANGEIFNVGPAYALTTKEFVAAYSRIYGVDIPVRWVGWPEYTTNIQPDICTHYHFGANMAPDISKISTVLGYRPKHTPEESMARAVAWMRETNLL